MQEGPVKGVTQLVTQQDFPCLLPCKGGQEISKECVHTNTAMSYDLKSSHMPIDNKASRINLAVNQ